MSEHTGSTSGTSWAERAADRSPAVQRSRTRSMQQAQLIVAAARRLIVTQGERFTTQDLIKEAHIALQTFYRHFAGKDQLIIAVLGDLIAEAAARWEERARDLPNPLDRLRTYVVAPLRNLGAVGHDNLGPRFVTAEHLRLHQFFPDEVAEATRPVADLMLREIEAARAEGLLAPTDPERDAWVVTRLVMSTYHHYAFVTTDESLEDIGEHLWSFCLAALGGTRPTRPTGPSTQPTEQGTD